jgi:hypothetical protein
MTKKKESLNIDRILKRIMMITSIILLPLILTTSIYSIIEIENLKYNLDFVTSEIRENHRTMISSHNRFNKQHENIESYVLKLESDIFQIDWNLSMGLYK